MNDRRVFPAKVVGVDKLNDLAVIKIDAQNLTTAPWGDWAKLRTGETVLAFGNPFGTFPFTVTRGIVSGLDRPNPDRSDLRKPGAFIQTDAAINPGNSGRPLVKCIRASGRNQHMDRLRNRVVCGRRLRHPIADCRDVSKRDHQERQVQHGYLGIGINSVTPENSSFFNLPDASGAIVSEVTPDSPASNAGLKSGDVLREMNGKKIDNASSFQVAVSEMAPGTQINLDILRDGKPDTIHATVGQYHSGNNSQEASNGASGNEHAQLGISVANLTADVRQQYNVPGNVNGAVIESVRPGSPADDAGLTPGDVILSIDRHPVENADSLVSQMHAQPAGKDVLLLVWANGGSSYLVIHPAANSQNG